MNLFHVQIHIRNANLFQKLILGNPISRHIDVADLGQCKTLKSVFFQRVDKNEYCPICIQPDYRQRMLELMPSLHSLDGERRKHPFVGIDKVVEEEVSLEIPEVDKVFDVFDLSMPQFSEDHLEEVMQQPLEKLQDTRNQCSDALERFQNLCDKQRKKFEN